MNMNIYNYILDTYLNKKQKSIISHNTSRQADRVITGLLNLSVKAKLSIIKDVVLFCLSVLLSSLSLVLSFGLSPHGCKMTAVVPGVTCRHDLIK